MMAQRQVVVVREAQQVKNINDLEIYLRQAPETTVLVICYSGKSVDKRTALYKAAVAKGAVLESVTLRDDEVPNWITRYASEVGVELMPEAALLLADYLGSDLHKICMEMDKLMALLSTDNRRITPDVVEKNVGISKEHSPFALCKAISFKDLPKALRIACYFGENPKNYPLVMVLATLFSHFARILKYHSLQNAPEKLSRQEIANKLGMNLFFLGEIETAARHFSVKQTAQAIWLLRAYDGRNKSNEKGEADDGALLKELLYKILR